VACTHTPILIPIRLTATWDDSQWNTSLWSTDCVHTLLTWFQQHPIFPRSPSEFVYFLADPITGRKLMCQESLGSIASSRPGGSPPVLQLTLGRYHRLRGGCTSLVLWAELRSPSALRWIPPDTHSYRCCNLARDMRMARTWIPAEVQFVATVFKPVNDPCDPKEHLVPGNFHLVQCFGAHVHPQSFNREVTFELQWLVLGTAERGVMREKVAPIVCDYAGEEVTVSTTKTVVETSDEWIVTLIPDQHLAPGTYRWSIKGPDLHAHLFEVDPLSIRLSLWFVVFVFLTYPSPIIMGLLARLRPSAARKLYCRRNTHNALFKVRQTNKKQSVLEHLGDDETSGDGVASAGCGLEQEGIGQKRWVADLNQKTRPVDQVGVHSESITPDQVFRMAPHSGESSSSAEVDTMLPESKTEEAEHTCPASSDVLHDCVRSQSVFRAWPPGLVDVVLEFVPSLDGNSLVVIGARGPTLLKTCVARIDLREEVQSTPGAALVATAFPPPAKGVVVVSKMWGTRISRKQAIICSRMKGAHLGHARCWCPAKPVAKDEGATSKVERVDMPWVRDIGNPNGLTTDTHGKLYHVKLHRSEPVITVVRFSLGDPRPRKVTQDAVPIDRDAEVVGAVADDQCLYVCLSRHVYLTREVANTIMWGTFEFVTHTWKWSPPRRSRMLSRLCVALLPPWLTGADRNLPVVMDVADATDFCLHVYTTERTLPADRFVFESPEGVGWGSVNAKWFHLPPLRTNTEFGAAPARVDLHMQEDGRLVLSVLSGVTEPWNELGVWAFEPTVAATTVEGAAAFAVGSGMWRRLPSSVGLTCTHAARMLL
jgi:hypothetical protein